VPAFKIGYDEIEPNLSEGSDIMTPVCLKTRNITIRGGEFRVETEFEILIDGFCQIFQVN
jgi:hypothetical protein